MAEAALELRAILDAAEQAAAAEDFVSAERHLRQAAHLQEAHLGPMHHDLANTLNNLGIVYEHVGNAADAEACYRRAYRIASTSLPPDHPLVQTSGQNLRDFCAAVGKPLDLREPPPELDAFASESASRTKRAEPAPVPKPTSPPVPLAAPLPPKPTEVRAPQAPPPARQPTAAARIALPVSPPASRPTAGIVIAAGLVLALAAWWFGFRESPTPAGPADVRVETPAPRDEPIAPREQPAPPAASVAAEPGASKDAPLPPPPPKNAPPASAKESSRPVRAVASGAVSVAEAKLCRSLSRSNWVCTPATNPAAPGVFFFYTRVQSPRDITVQHRWLLNGRLLRSVSLRIGANPGAGYRTYSRNTVSAERRGDWTLELRDAGGALLHEERFTVQ